MNENIVVAIRRLLAYLERPTAPHLFVQAWDRLNAEGMDIDLQRTLKHCQCQIPSMVSSEQTGPDRRRGSRGDEG
jgi:hypothetical protein